MSCKHLIQLVEDVEYGIFCICLDRALSFMLAEFREHGSCPMFRVRLVAKTPRACQHKNLAARKGGRWPQSVQTPLSPTCENTWPDAFG